MCGAALNGMVSRQFSHTCNNGFSSRVKEIQRST